ncbi:MAG: YaiI/YqxD family protein [Firmicutes bacterium HGW-Firmicutes-7]|nr:MAG: YaiI/YqxD family protein [Firmicutes bacterium HGW-Firmicutes-7]
MKIVVDGDACPAKELIKELAKKYNIAVHIFVDSSHYFEDEFFEIHVVSKGTDAVDIALVNFMDKGDLIITQDYGLASMALTKTNDVINPLGFKYSLKNIDELLFKRHIAHKARRAGKGYTKNKKRTADNNERFYETIESILKSNSTGIV